MKIDILSIIHIMFLAFLIVSIFSYVLYSIKGTVRKLKNKVVSGNFLRAINYSKHMLIKNYNSFEKYDIWRYSIHF